MLRRQLTVSSIIARSVALTLAASGAVTAAPVSYSGGTYSQNFDGLPSSPPAFSQTLTGRGPHELTAVTGATGVDGWFFSNYAGSSTNTEFRAQDGSLSGSAGRGVVSFGTEASTERALGGLPTSNQVPRWGVVLTNNSSDTYAQVDVSFITEQWRRGDVVPPGNTAPFAYSLTAVDLNDDPAFTAHTPLDLVSINNQVAPDPTNIPLNGNDPANRQAVSSSITGLSWTPGSSLLLRWSLPDITGQDNGLAIDNFSFTAVVPEPAGVFAAAGLLLGALHRRRR